jgi:hypothetical protein
MSIDSLSQTIHNLIQNNQTSQAAQPGTVSGTGVIVGGNVYPALYRVDFPTNDGDTVYVVLSDDKTQAVVIGR